jgi:hypothetical protein
VIAGLSKNTDGHFRLSVNDWRFALKIFDLHEDKKHSFRHIAGKLDISIKTIKDQHQRVWERVYRDECYADRSNRYRRETDKVSAILCQDCGKRLWCSDLCAEAEECRNQRKQLESEFAAIKAELKKKVDGILEESFLDSSEKGLLDKVLTTEIKEPKLHQLQDNISKLGNQESWHRKKMNELSMERQDLEQESKGITAGELAESITKGMDLILDRIQEAREQFEPFLQDVYSLQRLKPGTGADGWYSLLKKHGAPGWIATMIDSHLTNLRSAELFEWLLIMMDYRHPDNPMFQPALVNRNFNRISETGAFNTENPSMELNEIADTISRQAIDMQ